MSVMNRKYLITGSLLGALAVGLGAFGAHGLKKIVAPETVATFQTGVQYQMYHALALILVAILSEKFPGKWIKWAGACFITGTILFSGSLYLLTVLKATDKVGLDGVGILTPFGGLFFILGWLFLLMAVIKKN
jgi:uncharacterized membrane protein YgdD (TMEM256/DUF423 family)